MYYKCKICSIIWWLFVGNRLRTCITHDVLLKAYTHVIKILGFKKVSGSRSVCTKASIMHPATHQQHLRVDIQKLTLFLRSTLWHKCNSVLGYDMSTFIRRYGRYLNEKAFAYRQMAFDFTRVKKGYVNHGYHSLCWKALLAYHWGLVIHQFTSLAQGSFSLIVVYLVLHPVAVIIPAEYLISLSRSLSAEGVMRTMTTEKLLKGMPVLQTQIDTLLEFDVSPTLAWFLLLFYSTASHDDGFSLVWKPLSHFFPSSSQVHPKELNNGIINAAFMLLFKDLVKLFASYNDGIINLLGQ